MAKKRLRIYNVHFESFGLNRQDSIISKVNAFKFKELLQSTLKKQNGQLLQFDLFQKENPNPYVICTDLNNNAFSKSYNLLKSDRKDAFVEAGEGLGTTYWFSFFPLRIDYIFTSPEISVLSFKTFNKIEYSDHKPIMASIRIP